MAKRFHVTAGWWVSADNEQEAIDAIENAVAKCVEGSELDSSEVDDQDGDDKDDEG